jgi:geranylgeranyl reductase family protein
VLLLEREELPRYKRCGGGIVGLSRDVCGLTECELDAVTDESIRAVTWTTDGRWSRTRRVGADHPPILRLVTRDRFDAALVDLAVAAGVQVRTRATVLGVEQDADGVTVLLRDADPIRARLVIGADGSASRVAAHVGVECRLVDLGLEGEYPALDDRFAGRVLLDWGPVPGSYGWVFPKGNSWTVGVIGDRRRSAELRAYYDEFVASVGLTRSVATRDGGHLTRARTAGSPLRRGRVLVAGDAAGLLEPWSREGISYALRSGAIAGECAAMGRPELYPARIASVLGEEMAAGQSVLGVFERHPLLLHVVLAGLPGSFGLFQRLIDGRTTLTRQVDRPGVAPVLKRLSLARLSQADPDGPDSSYSEGRLDPSRVPSR